MVGIAVALEWSMLAALVQAQSIAGIVCWWLYIYFSATWAVVSNWWAEEG